MKYLLSIDFSVQQSGYALLQEDEHRNIHLIKFGTITEGSVNEYNKDTYDEIEFELTSEDRLLKQIENIDNYINACLVFEIDSNICFALEDSYYKTNAKVFKDAVLFQGMMRLYCHSHNQHLTLLHATSWRKGKIKAKRRDEQKQEAIEYVNNRFGLNLTYNKNKLKSFDDVAEAIILGISALEREGIPIDGNTK